MSDLRRVSSRRVAAACALAVSLAASACTPSERRFESVCQIIRREPVETDESGRTTQLDVELEWDSCPGDQYQMVRGGRDFAACLQRYHDGEMVPVRVSQRWDSRGFFTWDIYRVGDCPRPIVAESEGSFERSQECRDTDSHGVANGFVCSRRPHAGLIAVCPWLARR